MFLCDAGLTCDRLLNFLTSQEVDFVCAISQGRVDVDTGEKLRDLWFPEPEDIRLSGVSEPVYAYRLNEDTDRERVVISNRRLSKKKFGSYYRYRWKVESEIRTLKATGLERYMVRRLRAIELWIKAVWHVSLLRLVSRLGGFDFKEYLLSLVYPSSVVAIARLLEFAKGVAGRCLRFSPFPDDRLLGLVFQDLIGSDSCRAKV